MCLKESDSLNVARRSLDECIQINPLRNQPAGRKAVGLSVRRSSRKWRKSQDLRPNAMEPPPPLPLLASAVVVGRSHHVEALPHVVERISAFLDSVALERWSVPRACEQNDLRLLHRVAAREPHEMDPHYKKLLASQGLVAAVRNNSLQIVSWLCLEYCPPLIPMKAIEEAARLGKSDILEWLFANHKSALWTKKIAGAAVENGHLVVLQLALPHIETGEVVAELHCRAAQCGHLEVVSWLHGHRTQSQLSTTALDFTGVWDQRVLLNTILAGHFEVAQFLVSKGYPLVIDRYRHVGLSASWGNLEMIRWLLTIPEAKRSTGWIDGAAGAGHLHMVKWAHKNLKNDRCSENAMDNAATNGHLEVIKWLHENRTEGCTTRAMDGAAENGHLDTVHWLHEHRNEGCTTGAMDRAAARGQMETVQWLHTHRSEGCTTSAMDDAARNGHLQLVQWLHINRSEGCRARAMDLAASEGHLGVVQWLHENRSEGCTSDAMDYAAKNGHLDVVKWLHENRTEGCTIEAMDNASSLPVTQWLQENRTEGCTIYAMENATRFGCFDTLLYLHANRNEGPTHRTALCAVASNSLEIFEWVYATYRNRVNLDRIAARCGWKPNAYASALVEQMRSSERE